jgi:putative ABC transport system permease protein
MIFGLTELRRRPGRFVAATVILTLIALLLLFLGGLLDGLIANATNGLRAQPGQLIVYSATAQDNLARSRLTGDQQAAVDTVEGVADTGGLGSLSIGARVPGRGEKDLIDVSLFGYELPPEGVPDPPEPGQAWADETLRGKGVDVGMSLLLGPARTPVTVVGFVSDTSYGGYGTLWSTLDTWRSTQNANRPDARVPDDVVQAVVVRAESTAAADVAALAGRIDAAMGGSTRTLTVEAAANALPGVAQQRSTFTQIIGVTVVVAGLVIALFFALIVVERTGLYGVLKAMGSRTSALFAGVLTQAATVTLVASLIAGALALALAAALPPGSLPFLLTPGRIAFSVALLLVASVLGCVTSLRRVLRIHPASAIGS